MKHFAKRNTALALVLLMIASLLASCREQAENPKEESAGEIVSEIVHDSYLPKVVDLGLSEKETVMDVTQAEDGIRLTIGVTSDEVEDTYGTSRGIPYKTEYRYYDMAFTEDETKRESTTAYHEAARTPDPSVDLAFGGEPYQDGGSYTGAQYHFYRDGTPTDHVIIPEDQKNDSPAAFYNARANLLLIEDTIYAGICGINVFDNSMWSLYVKDHFVKKDVRKPNVEVVLHGLMAIDGTPYALIREYTIDMGDSVYNYFADETETAYLVPLTPDTTDLSGGEIKVDGRPTGGAFGGGKYGYYMCSGELWRTDGKNSKCIADMIYCGIDETSVVRNICPLSDGRILVAANGGLIELTGSESIVPAERSIYTLGAVNAGYAGLLSTTVAKFNSQSDSIQFVVKEYPNVTKMNLALLSGEVDLVVSSDRLMLKNYVKQGLLVPLEEVAPELFEEGILIENIVDATHIDGTCYYLPRSFHINGRIIKPDILEEGKTFTTAKEFYDFILEKTPESMKTMYKDMQFTNYGTNIDEWIDWETNTAHFDDGTFEAVLELCNHGAAPDEEWGSSADVEAFSIHDIVNENIFCDMEVAKEYKGQYPWMLIPIPSSTHDGYDIESSQYFAVVDKDGSREAAHAFLTWHFLEDVMGEIPPDQTDGFNEVLYQIGYSDLSINRAECERYIGRNLALEGEGNEERLVVEQRRYEDTWKIIHSADHLWYFRNAVFDVVMEEAYRYFAGEITATQAADYVQNRISLYLAEQG